MQLLMVFGITALCVGCGGGPRSAIASSTGSKVVAPDEGADGDCETEMFDAPEGRGGSSSSKTKRA